MGNGRLFRHALLAVLLAAAPALGEAGGPVGTKVVKQSDGHYELLRGGKPYFIKGAGGGGSKEELAAIGGNSFRTWGVGGDTPAQLDEAEKLGLTVTVGIWLGHKDQGFNWSDAAAVKQQLEDAKKSVERLKGHPAILMWALGNEMENNNDVPEVWKAIEEMARMVHQVDPLHPTMTVVAEIGGDKVRHIHEYCPDIDVVGINSYGGGASLAERYRKAGGTKPFVVTEYGPAGTWETQLTSFHAAPELTSTQKAEQYRRTYEKSVAGAPGLCLGSYAFTWGSKIEATATWFGMLLPDGSKLAAVDTMQELWTGKAPAHPCPAITALRIVGKDEVNAGDEVKAHVDCSDPQGDPLTIEWHLYREQASYEVQGGGADPTPSFPEAIVKNGERDVTMHMPAYGGIYRIYCYVHNAHKGAAVGSLPVGVTGPDAPFKAAAAKLPLVVYASAQGEMPYIPSGWMGNTGAIHMDLADPSHPHSGKTSLKVSYSAKDNWGGVVWQSPANDWGDRPGGFDLTGAKKLTFWARGEKGGERVKFGYGIIDSNKKYHDSSKDSLSVELTPEWKQYTIDLAGKDLSCIKSGFVWTLGGSGAPVAFYLDQIEFE